MEIRVTYRIRTKDPEVLCWNPVIGVLESQSELIRAAGECEYVLSDIMGVVAEKGYPSQKTCLDIP